MKNRKIDSQSNERGENSISLYNGHRNSTIVKWMLFLGVLFLFSDLLTAKPKSPRKTISLAGKWSFQADPNDVGEKDKWFEKEFKDWIKLPGSTDEKGLGEEEKYEDPYSALIRKSFYVGKAWYQKEVNIPKSWNNKQINLFLERCHWVTQVWVDNQYIGEEDSLCVAHKYDLSKYLTPGKHKITICVNNKLKFFLGKFASSFSKHTQTNWNGIIGRIELNAMDKVWIKDLQIYPQLSTKTIKVKLNIGNATGKPVDGEISVQVLAKDGNCISNFNGKTVVKNGNTMFEASIPLSDKLELWNDCHPTLYKFKAQIKSNDLLDVKSITAGIREISVKDRQICVNGKKIYLRGTLECCVFPLTGYPPMSVKEWSRIMKICKSHGLNHIRFHSWCPPQAAFDAADIAGIYLQPEAPRANIGPETNRDKFIEREMYKINRFYGNNPSFLLMTGGNELHSATSSKTKAIMQEIKKSDPRHLLSTSSGGHGMTHKNSNSRVDDYRVSGIRGFFGDSTDKDHSQRIIDYAKPIISHEVGQWQTYPDPNEIKKYTGVLRPINIEYIRDDLKKRGLLHLVGQFREVTGKQAALLYKEEIEVLLRTKRHAGFQLLDLHDYPGQGTAQVGILDAFWDSKGAITAKEFRNFCSETVPLLRMPKRIYRTNEEFSASAEIVHYGNKTLKDITPRWTLSDDTGKVITSGKMKNIDIIQGERTQIGQIKIDFTMIKKPGSLKITINIPNTEVMNSWDIWVYPKLAKEELPENIVMSETINEEVLKALEDGNNILLLPTTGILKNVLPGRFKPSFWSPTWWWTKPRGGNVTMSILCDPKHPALKYFPTQNYSNWQWLDLQEKSSSIMLEKLPVKINPIVRVIDNFSRNHDLGSIFEVKIGNSKVLICAIDIIHNLDNRPVAQQLRHSLVKYMQSKEFAPKQSISLDAIKSMYRRKSLLAELGAKIANVDSAQEGYEAKNAIDGNNKTIWHTKWKPNKVSYPHEFTIQLPHSTSIEGFIYLPRQDQSSGRIKKYEIYLSKDGKKWGAPVMQGSFPNSKDEVKLMFPRLKHSCKYIRFVAKSGHNNSPCAAVAEFSIVIEK